MAKEVDSNTEYASKLSSNGVNANLIRIVVVNKSEFMLFIIILFLTLYRSMFLFYKIFCKYIVLYKL